jgi:hypothetical protein
VKITCNHKRQEQNRMGCIIFIHDYLTEHA